MLEIPTERSYGPGEPLTLSFLRGRPDKTGFERIESLRCLFYYYCVSRLASSMSRLAAHLQGRLD